MSNEFDGLWIEAYRPHTFDKIILSPETRTKLEEYRDKGAIPNLLFCSPPGQGKTTVAKIIVNDLLDCQYLYINASDENGIDTIRSKVVNFAQTKSIDGKVKAIILDEADFLSAQAQAALRNTMETFASLCRFILTANTKHKIIPAIQSRCTKLTIGAPLRLAAIRCVEIAEAEVGTIGSDDKKKIVEIVKRNFPDIRSAINEMQVSFVGDKLNSTISAVSSTFCGEVLELIRNKKALKARELLISNEQEFNGDYPQFMKELLNLIFNSSDDDEIKSQWCMIIADHLFRSSLVADQEINNFNCLLKMQTIKL
jgi:DNA polymerase III delta prime subunit